MKTQYDLRRAIEQADLGINKLFLIYIAKFADPDGTKIFPSVDTMSQEAGISDRAVQNNLRRLEDAGFIKVINQRRAESRGTREYAINVEAILERINPRRMFTPDPEESSPPPRRIFTPPPKNLHPTYHRPTIDPPEDQYICEAEVSSPPSMPKGQTEGTAPRAEKEPKAEIVALHPNGAPSVEASDFEAFWQAYPKQAKRKDAEKAWCAAITKADPQTIIRGAEAYANSGQTVFQNPGNWLREERWTEKPRLRNRGDGSAITRAQSIGQRFASGYDSQRSYLRKSDISGAELSERVAGRYEARKEDRRQRNAGLIGGQSNG